MPRCHVTIRTARTEHAGWVTSHPKAPAVARVTCPCGYDDETTGDTLHDAAQAGQALADQHLTPRRSRWSPRGLGIMP